MIILINNSSKADGGQVEYAERGNVEKTRELYQSFWTKKNKKPKRETIVEKSTIDFEDNKSGGIQKTC